MGQRFVIKIDLHTHSTASSDGGISLNQYKKILDIGLVNQIAITDHDRIDFAQNAQKIIGKTKIIVGQEISTTDGDIIGLFLTKKIPAGLTAKLTTKIIKDEGGVVYIPHPFETIRKGITLETLDSIKHNVDIVEVDNGRAFFQNLSHLAKKWAKKNSKLTVASSDAHGYRGVGRTYTVIKDMPKDKKSLLENLKDVELVYKKPNLFSLTYPTRNRIKTKLGIKNV